MVKNSPWRDSLLRGSVFLGVAVAVLTEVLGAFNLLNRPVLSGVWLFLFAAVAWFVRKRILGCSFRVGPWPGFLNVAAIAGISVIAALIGLTAVLSPPNSTDAMAYHLPRIVYWAQAGSVGFFPTHYYNQIMLQPMAEYVVLHTYILSGGDRYANLVQFYGYLGSVIGVSLIAKILGAGARGQVLAALFCATLPNGILQASGTKNDYVVALWLVAMAYFALRFVRGYRAADLAAMSAALALALFTKGTAYVFAPPVLAAIFLPALRTNARLLFRAVPALVVAILLVNGPLYWRNFFFSGSVLGFDSAHGDGKFRWRNEQFGVGVMLSNLMRNVSEHLGGRSPEWNNRVYDAVVRAHGALGIDVNDPASTWRWSQFEAPRNANHEANANNKWHLLFLAFAVIPLVWLAWRGRKPEPLLYYLGVVCAFVFFCALLKWQPFQARMHLPVFVLGSPAAGLLLERIRPAFLQALPVLFLLSVARLPVVENWTRPLEGPGSILRTSRTANYFSDMAAFEKKENYLQAVDKTLESGCTTIGIDISQFPLEYPYQALILERQPAARFFHTGVRNHSARYARTPVPEPCAILCLRCAGNAEKLKFYSYMDEAAEYGSFLLFLEKACY